MPPAERVMPASSGSSCILPTVTWARASSPSTPTSVPTLRWQLDNRSRFLLETLAAVREVWPENLPLTARFGVLEYDGRDEQTLEESIELARRFKAGGLDLLSVSVGFTIPETNIPWGPAFMGPIAERVRREAKLPVTSAWGFGTPQLAEGALQANQLDLVSVGRAHLADPHWAYFAAKELGVEKASWTLPAPYAHWLERYR